MSRLTVRLALTVLALWSVLGLAACGRGGNDGPDSGAPVAGIGAPKEAAHEPEVDLGFPSFATKNTTRVAASDPVAVAAATARAVYPGLTPESRPDAVALVDRRDWRTALAASVLMSSPVRAPLLFSDGAQKLPEASQTALDAMDPSGSKPAGGAEVVRVGTVPRPNGRKTTDVAGTDPFALAQALDAFQAAARGKTSDRVMIVSADEPAFAAPAAGYAAKSGDPILFTRKDSLPPPTIAALKTHQDPKIYVVGPTKVIGAKVTRALRKLGTVVRIGGPDPVRNAIAFASFSETDFGWGVVDPGHGLVFARSDADPALAAAASPLSASGTYGPLLLNASAQTIDAPLSTYLKGIQPGYATDPVRGVYNHGWIIGKTDTISVTAQARIDALLEIVPVRTPDAPPVP